MKKPLRYTLFTLVGIFAVIGLVFTAVFIGMRFGIFNVKGSISSRNQSITGGSNVALSDPCTVASKITCSWNETPEWEVVSGGLTKDASIIARVSAETGVSSRMIAAVVIPEQIRFFTSNREIFKSYFEPLKILGSLTQFSLGVSGIKEDTANMIEANATNTASLLYPGDGIASLITYTPNVDHDKELYDRLTNDKDHYYSYLYTALFIKEIEMQWSRAGFDVSQKPEVVTTLFNLGFGASVPKADPQVGGAPITTGGEVYSYGELGADFYHSSELSSIFQK